MGLNLSKLGLVDSQALYTQHFPNALLAFLNQQGINDGVEQTYEYPLGHRLFHVTFSLDFAIENETPVHSTTGRAIPDLVILKISFGGESFSFLYSDKQFYMQSHLDSSGYTSSEGHVLSHPLMFGMSDEECRRETPARVTKLLAWLTEIVANKAPIKITPLFSEEKNLNLTISRADSIETIIPKAISRIKKGDTETLSEEMIALLDRDFRMQMAFAISMAALDDKITPAMQAFFRHSDLARFLFANTGVARTHLAIKSMFAIIKRSDSVNLETFINLLEQLYLLAALCEDHHTSLNNYAACHEIMKPLTELKLENIPELLVRHSENDDDDDSQFLLSMENVKSIISSALMKLSEQDLSQPNFIEDIADHLRAYLQTAIREGCLTESHCYEPLLKTVWFGFSWPVSVIIQYKILVREQAEEAEALVKSKVQANHDDTAPYFFHRLAALLILDNCSEPARHAMALVNQYWHRAYIDHAHTLKITNAKLIASQFDDNQLTMGPSVPGGHPVRVLYDTIQLHLADSTTQTSEFADRVANNGLTRLQRWRMVLAYLAYIFNQPDVDSVDFELYAGHHSLLIKLSQDLRDPHQRDADVFLHSYRTSQLVDNFSIFSERKKAIAYAQKRGHGVDLVEVDGEKIPVIFPRTDLKI